MSETFDNWDSETGAKSKKFEGYGYTVPSNSPLETIMNVLKKPVTLMVLFLCSALIMISLKFGALQMELNKVEKKVVNYSVLESSLDKRVKKINRELTQVEKEERELKKKEAELAAKELKLEQGSWGEEGEKHEIKMEPLITRHPHIEIIKEPASSQMGKTIAEIFGGLADKLATIRKTGPAPHHKFHMIPLEDILKPGPHPSHGNDKSEEKMKEEHHVHHVTKEDEEQRHAKKIE